MNIKEKQEKIINELELSHNQLVYLLDRGRLLHDTGAIKNIRSCHLSGFCKGTRLKNDKIHIEAYSDSTIMNGILSIFIEMYKGESTDDVQNNPPIFLQSIKNHILNPAAKHFVSIVVEKIMR